MRLSKAVPTLFALLCTAAPAFAQKGDGERSQDGLTPTDVLPFARITGDIRLQAAVGSGTFDAFAGTVNEDIELSSFIMVLQAAAGLGAGFEVELALPVAFAIESQVDGSTLEVTQESEGVGDLSLQLNYAILRESAVEPQVVGGLIVIAPTGDDDPGQAEFVSGGIKLADGETAGIGNGTFQFGFQAGVSKRFDSIEPYLAFRYLFGGSSEAGNVDTDHADVGTVAVGVEFHAGDQVSVDLRAVFNFNAKEVEEDPTGVKSTEEAHVDYALETRVYASMGPTVALVFGVMLSGIEDHALDKEADINLKETFVIGAEIGIRVVFGR